jgi:hypothetical protein
MESSTKIVQILVLTFIMALGVVAGTSLNSYGQTNPGEQEDPCGYCDYHEGSDLYFCNFTLPSDDCDGNDGGDCGGLLECF